MRGFSYVALTAVVLLLLFFSSCGNSHSADKNTYSTNKNSRSYEITDCQYLDIGEADNQSITISYPQIENLSDEKVQETINTQLREIAFRVLGSFDGFDDMDVNVNYTIRRASCCVLSVHFVWTSFHVLQAYPLILSYSANFSLNSGDRLKLLDIVTLDENTISDFMEIFTLQEGRYTEDTIDLVNRQIELSALSMENLLLADGDYYTAISSLITDNSLIISVEVIKALGSYVLYEAQLSKLAEVVDVNFDLLCSCK